MLDQEIAPAGPVGQQRLNLAERNGIDLAALRGLPGSAPASSGTVKSCGPGMG
jgi:hypothetical protein